ncbi:hypothetical protein CES87_28225 [Pseudomonas sp. ERMR1:02]|nr:hypothetical protein CES87_28225 [Pseudomonas sp. ERMR1:02]
MAEIFITPPSIQCRSCRRLRSFDLDRSRAPRGNASRDAPRPVTRSVTGCIPTQSVGTIKRRILRYAESPAAVARTPAGTLRACGGGR